MNDDPYIDESSAVYVAADIVIELVLATVLGASVAGALWLITWWYA